MQFWIDLGKAYQGKLFRIECDLNSLSFVRSKCVCREGLNQGVERIKTLASTC